MMTLHASLPIDLKCRRYVDTQRERDAIVSTTVGASRARGDTSTQRLLRIHGRPHACRSHALTGAGRCSQIEQNGTCSLAMM
jgi:hypothetical protein